MPKPYLLDVARGLGSLPVVFRRALGEWLRSVGLRAPKPQEFPLGYDAAARCAYLEAEPYTMTDKRRVLALIEAVRYLERCQIEGDIVECGVWRGGSMMAASRSLIQAGNTRRRLVLYDTFAGMVSPTALDVNHAGEHAAEKYQKAKLADREGSSWCYCALPDVQRNLAQVGYPPERIQFVEGKVEDTLPKTTPERIALLRLDTDLYESTRAEMEYLYPRLVPGGVLIVDDYLYWGGSRAAVDEYVHKHGLRLLLTPIDGGGVIAVKQD